MNNLPKMKNFTMEKRATSTSSRYDEDIVIQYLVKH